MNNMNSDLEFRLKPFMKLTDQECQFFGLLQARLGQRALSGLWMGGHLVYCFGHIENGEDDSAYVLGDGHEFELFLDTRMPFGMVVDFLLHELAHLHSWDVADDKEDHCEEFGKSYALLYRDYLKLYEEFWND